MILYKLLTLFRVVTLLTAACGLAGAWFTVLAKKGIYVWVDLPTKHTDQIINWWYQQMHQAAKCSNELLTLTVLFLVVLMMVVAGYLTVLLSQGKRLSFISSIFASLTTFLGLGINSWLYSKLRGVPTDLVAEVGPVKISYLVTLLEKKNLYQHSFVEAWNAYFRNHPQFGRTIFSDQVTAQLALQLQQPLEETFLIGISTKELVEQACQTAQLCAEKEAGLMIATNYRWYTSGVQLAENHPYVVFGAVSLMLVVATGGAYLLRYHHSSGPDPSMQAVEALTREMQHQAKLLEAAAGTAQHLIDLSQEAAKLAQKSVEQCVTSENVIKQCLASTTDQAELCHKSLQEVTVLKDHVLAKTQELAQSVKPAVEQTFFKLLHHLRTSTPLFPPGVTPGRIDLELAIKALEQRHTISSGVLLNLRTSHLELKDTVNTAVLPSVQRFIDYLNTLL